ncbi:LytR C-terminal domain-containing protein [Microbacterium esteraromaticum]|uniref:LytR C-terminal domain-containing protein n=1 Tax=Microbacterium esteraromaticum TaxID=57043 RepID=UPI0023684922|nr:LytR C-terminal domain-containing protein [Microbacterium esteraromaticum]WDH78127.1 LytR C-terminal domain-containing protein [Microbacterium esteraromaticum]
MSQQPHDRFDDIPRGSGRVGAHRAEQPGMNALVVLLWSAAVALVLIVAGIFAALVMMDRISFGSGDSSPSASQSEEGTAAEIDTSYRVLILNATSQEGLVAEAEETLQAQGWAQGDVFGSDRASEEFETTTVFYVDDTDEAAALGVAEVIGGAAVQQSDFYADFNDSEHPQLTVVLGTDRVSGGAPSTNESEDSPAE